MPVTHRFALVWPRSYGFTSIGLTKKLQLNHLQFATFDEPHGIILLTTSKRGRPNTMELSVVLPGSDDLRSWWFHLDLAMQGAELNHITDGNDCECSCCRRTNRRLLRRKSPKRSKRTRSSPAEITG